MVFKSKLSKAIFGAYFILVMTSSNMVLFDGVTADTSNMPAPRSSHVMVYDSIHNQTILFGGYKSGVDLTDLSSTWVFSSNNLSWSEINSDIAPEPRFDHNMVFNPNTGKILLFSGINIQSGARVNDTWEFDPITYEWLELDLDIAPSGRSSHSMYYDSEYNEIILFGGSEYTEVYDDTWIFNCSTNTWVEVFPATNPGLRYGHSMVYNEEKRIGVMFGGRYSNGDQVDETWFFNRTALNWEKQYPPLKPLKRYFAGMIYNSYTSEILLFGGDNENTLIRAVDDTWLFSTSTAHWTRVYPTTKPEPRSHPSMVFDTYLNKTMLFGGVGEDYSRTFGDVWFYDFSVGNWFDEITSSASIPIWFIIIASAMLFGYTINVKKGYIRRHKSS